MKNYANTGILLPEMQSKKNILIAEDDLTARTILTGILKKWDYEVVAVNDGLSAWETIQQKECPNLIILDWMMPGMDGLEVVRRVRAQNQEPPPYIILLSSKDNSDDIVSGLQAGANDYIKKPFDHEELYARLNVGQRTVELQTRLYEAQQTLMHQATHDSLTGILNRRAILERLAKELSRFHRTNNKIESLGIGFMDIDHFKTINDRFGHQVGDEVLCGLVNIIKAQIRLYDEIGRLGGDEFLIIVPGLDESNRKNFFNRLCKLICSSHIATSAGNIGITTSIGIGIADETCSLDQLIEKADTAMYAAKSKGGNQVGYAA